MTETSIEMSSVILERLGVEDSCLATASEELSGVLIRLSLFIFSFENYHRACSSRIFLCVRVDDQQPAFNQVLLPDIH